MSKLDGDTGKPLTGQSAWFTLQRVEKLGTQTSCEKNVPELDR